jgi:hypothetical protein
MSVVKERIEINAPIERVWETIMDPRRFGQWVSIHRSVSHVSPDPQAKGATMDQVMHMRGVNFKVRWLLTEVEAPRLAVWDGHGPAHSRAGIRYELSGVRVRQRLPPARRQARCNRKPVRSRCGVRAGSREIVASPEVTARAGLTCIHTTCQHTVCLP